IKNPGHPLERAGKLVKGKQRTITDGPYAESKDIIGGYTLVEAKDLAEAVELSKGCPILEGGGVVEVRPVLPAGMGRGCTSIWSGGKRGGWLPRSRASPARSRW